MGLHGFHFDIKMGECCIRKARKNPATRYVPASRRKWRSRAWPRSARITERNLDTVRIPEQPSTTMPGIVEKIVPSPRPSQLEKAQIAVDGSHHRVCDFRIDSTLTDENGDDVRLTKGAHVEVTVTAETKSVNRRK
jgi:hypothetical protein